MPAAWDQPLHHSGCGHWAESRQGGDIVTAGRAPREGPWTAPSLAGLSRWEERHTGLSGILQSRKSEAWQPPAAFQVHFLGSFHTPRLPWCLGPLAWFSLCLLRLNDEGQTENQTGEPSLVPVSGCFRGRPVTKRSCETFDTKINLSFDFPANFLKHPRVFVRALPSPPRCSGPGGQPPPFSPSALSMDWTGKLALRSPLPSGPPCSGRSSCPLPSLPASGNGAPPPVCLLKMEAPLLFV